MNDERVELVVEGVRFSGSKDAVREVVDAILAGELEVKPERTERIIWPCYEPPPSSYSKYVITC